MNRGGPPLFSHFGKQVKDILTNDYSDTQRFSISSKTQTGLGLFSTVVNKGGLSSGDITAQYRFSNVDVDLKLDTQLNISTIVAIVDFLPSTKTVASCTLPDYNSGKFEVQYFHEHGSLTAAVDRIKSPTIDISATIGTPCVAFGTEASYVTTSGDFTKYNAGVSLTKPNICASVILSDKGDAVRVSYLHHLNRPSKGTAVAEIMRRFSTNENTLTVGCSYALDLQTVVKAKLNNHGHFGALLRHELTRSSSLVISGTFDTQAMERRPRFGLTLSLNP